MTRYRHLILGSLGACLLALSLLFVASIVWMEKRNLDQHFEEAFTGFARSYRSALEADGAMLRAVLRMLEERADMQEAFVRGDRDALLRLAEPLFRDLREAHRITHFYFHDADGVNFLRVHQPQRHGDTIERFTMRDARRDGVTAEGVELGPLGTFTLRVVVPWRDADGGIVGYLELGEEIDHIIARLNEDLQLDLFIFIDKAMVDRVGWEEGMLMLGRRPNWNQFPDVVLVASTRQPEPSLLEKMAGAAERVSGAPMLLATERQAFRGASFALTDAGGRPVGRLGAMLDQSGQTTAARNLVQWVVAAVIVLGTTLWLMFYLLLRRIEARMNTVSESRDQFLQMSRCDGLTGLFNHNELYRQLEVEVSRARRHGHALCLLMLDIDHFKQVNDAHGHPVGDEVLRATANLIQGLARPYDKAARYGGEEFSLVVPHTTVAEGYEMAERIRLTLADQVFDAPRGSFSIRMSIGIAGFPEDAASASELAANADAALYRAKRSGRDCTVRYEDLRTRNEAGGQTAA